MQMHSACSPRPSSLVSGKVSFIKQNQYLFHDCASIGLHRLCDVESRFLVSRVAYERRQLFVVAQSSREHIEDDYEYDMYVLE